MAHVASEFLPARQESLHPGAEGASRRRAHYLPAIDGLRAFAVMPVLFVHAGFPFFSGGFIGVDVFFVISGYLITGILEREIRAGRFSIAGFYERRARRILPALFLVLLASLPFAWFLILPHEFLRFGESLVAVNLFVSNLLFAHENGYFETIAAVRPTLHTWSLGVEEQFYILFPLFLWFVSRRFPRHRLAIFAGLFVLSMAFAEWMWRRDSSLNFYLLPSRAWELLAGAMLAQVSFDRESLAQHRPLLMQIASLAGLAAVCASYFLFNENTPSPSLIVAVPVIGALLVIACAVPGTLCHAILANPLARGIGIISYSAYLWHQPVFVFARLYNGAEPSVPVFIGLIGLTLLLAWLSWWFVERPFRDRSRFSRAVIFRFAGAGMIFFIAVGGGIVLAKGVPGRFGPAGALVQKGVDDISPYRDSCGEQIPPDFATYCLFGQARQPIVAVLGDSHGKELFWRMTQHLSGHPYRLQPFLWNASAPFASLTRGAADGRNTRAFHARARAYILGNRQIRTVVIAANWPMYFNCEDDFCATSPARPDLIHRPDDPARRAVVADAMAREIDAYRAAGKTVVLMAPVPHMPWDVPRFMLSRIIQGKSDIGAGVPRAEHEARAAAADAFLAREAKRPGVFLVDPAASLCGTGPAGFCHAEAGGMPLYFDDNHMNGAGADPVARAMLARLDRIAGAKP